VIGLTLEGMDEVRCVEPVRDTEKDGDVVEQTYYDVDIVPRKLRFILVLKVVTETEEERLI